MQAAQSQSLPSLIFSPTYSYNDIMRSVWKRSLQTTNCRPLCSGICSSVQLNHLLGRRCWSSTVADEQDENSASATTTKSSAPWYLRKETTVEFPGRIERVPLILPDSASPKVRDIADYLDSTLNLSNITYVDLSNLENGSPFEDDAVFLIATGTGSTHLASAGQSLATHIKKTYGQYIQTEGLLTPNFVRVLARRAKKKAQRKGITNRDPFEEGLDTTQRAGSWIVLKVDSIYIHMFTQDKRDHVNLEDLWQPRQSRGWKKFDQKFELPSRGYHTSARQYHTSSTAPNESVASTDEPLVSPSLATYIRDLEIQQACGFVLTDKDFTEALAQISHMTQHNNSTVPWDLVLDSRLQLIKRLHSLVYRSPGLVLVQNEDVLWDLFAAILAPTPPPPNSRISKEQDADSIATTVATPIDKRNSGILGVLASTSRFSSDPAYTLYLFTALVNSGWWPKFWGLFKSQMIQGKISPSLLGDIVQLVVTSSDESNIIQLLHYLPPILSDLHHCPESLSKGLHDILDYLQAPVEGVTAIRDFLSSTENESTHF